jgi:adenylyl-sulfate kinase
MKVNFIKNMIIKTIIWILISSIFILFISYNIFILIIIYGLLYYFYELIWYKILNSNKKNKVYWLTGLSGSGKTTIANELSKYLNKPFILDGDIFRYGLSKDLGFSKKDRIENHRRVAEIAKILSDLGYNVIVSFISPYEINRKLAKEIIGDKYFEIYINTPLYICKKRDPKGLYEKVEKGEIQNFTGIDDPYEIPKNPDLVIDTKLSPKKSVQKIINMKNVK